MFDYTMEHLFSFRAQVGAPQIYGECHDGIRAYFPVVSSEVFGPRVNGKSLPGGGDWITIRRDGVQAIDVRASVQTDDGAVIYACYSGVGDLGENGYQNYLDGTGPALVPLRAAARYQCGDPRYQWLNRLQCINIGEADVARLIISFDVYALH